MNTTNLLIELIVIGVAASIWIVLAVFTAFGYAWVSLDDLRLPLAAVPILALVYIFGIVSDRIADRVFKWRWADTLNKTLFPNRSDYYDALRLIDTQSERLSKLLEYGRIRLRICRGWAFNCILMVISLNTFTWVRLRDKPYACTISVVGTVSLVLFAVVAWYAWRDITLKSYKKIEGQVKYLTDHKSAKPKSTDV
jgi:hypothetical protein